MKKLAILLLGAVTFTAVASSFSDYASDQRDAIEEQDWDEAVSCTVSMINAENSSHNTASSFLQLGCLLWLRGDETKAANAIRQSLNIMGNSEDFDRAMAANARKLLNRLEASGNLSSTEKTAVANFVIALSHDAEDASGSDDDSPSQDEITIRRLDMANRRLDMQLSTLRRQGARFERDTKSKARWDYNRETGRYFDPDDRPSNAYEREKWDACKRIYDIFD